MSKTTLTNALSNTVNTEIVKFLKTVSVQFKIPLDKLEKLWNNKNDESEDSSLSEVKKPLDDESVSEMKPLKGGKKAVDSDDDSLPAAKKREVGKKTTKMVYEESDKPKDNSNLLPEDTDMKFLKGTNYILHKGVVVAGFSKNGVIPLMHAHIKSLESDAYADIKHEKLDKARLNKIFKCDALNQSIKSEKPPVKRNKK